MTGAEGLRPSARPVVEYVGGIAMRSAFGPLTIGEEQNGSRGTPARSREEMVSCTLM